MNGRNCRRPFELQRASYETSLRSELSAQQPAMLRRRPTLIYPLRSTHGMKLFADCDQKTTGVHSCLESRRKFNNSRNFSAARAVENVARAKIQPWQSKIEILNNQRLPWAVVLYKFISRKTEERDA